MCLSIHAHPVHSFVCPTSLSLGIFSSVCLNIDAFLYLSFYSVGFFFFISTTNYETLHSYCVAHKVPQTGLDLLPQLPPLTASVTYDLSNLPKLLCSRGLLR